jgi:hypothetical protein
MLNVLRSAVFYLTGWDKLHQIINTDDVEKYRELRSRFASHWEQNLEFLTLA